jgi:hypothetical protein
MLRNSRFNPTTGIADFWNEFRKPNPYKWAMLLAAGLPFAAIFYFLGSETYYKDPERPQITYITTLDPARSDAEIEASNLENQEIKELRKARIASLAQRKRDIYKALGSAAGMDVEEIERRADAERAEEETAEEAAEEGRRAEMFGRTGEDTRVEAGAEAGVETGVETGAGTGISTGIGTGTRAGTRTGTETQTSGAASESPGP